MGRVSRELATACSARSREHAPNRTVVLTGDIHSNWVNELHAGFDRPDRPVVAAEFVRTSMSSGGDGYARLLERGQRAEQSAHEMAQRATRLRALPRDA